MRVMAWVALATMGIGCSKGPTALEVCVKLEGVGVAEHCKKDEPGGLGAAAKDKASFDLAHVSGRTGQVLSFESDDKFEATVKSFQAVAGLAGPHRYGSRKARIFVQLNDELPDADGAKARAVVADLGDLVAPPQSAPASSPKPVVEAPESAQPSASARASDESPAMIACKKLEAAGAVVECRSSESKVSVKFGQKGSAVGIVSVYDSAKTFETVSKGMAKDKDKRTAANPKTRTLVMWSGDDASVDKKIRTAVDTL